MEPAAKRREHLGDERRLLAPRRCRSLPRGNGSRNGARRQRRELGLLDTGEVFLSTPQWSLPLTDGNTRSAQANRVNGDPAAMEPATEQGKGHPAAVRVHAAMEPTVGRREHAEVYGLACDKDQAPQWSPPPNGGRHSFFSQWRFVASCLQWSPLMTGESTVGDRRVGGGCRGAAMEPAMDWREQPANCSKRKIGIACPQWSPPLNGGNPCRSADGPRVRGGCRNGACQ
jgi:hypothetical protein